MTRSATFGLIALVSSVATPLVVSAGAPASAPAAAQITTMAAVAPTETVAVASAPASPCARRVRVVYQGYVTPAEGCAATR